MQFPNKKYGVIYSDPPWSFNNFSKKGEKKNAKFHYECMDLDDMKAMACDLHGICKKDCVLFMWATFPMLPEAIELMKAWGFEYKTGAAWHKKTKHGKTAFGTGYIFRSASELLLVGTKGKPKPKNRSTRNIIEGKIREHSRKPDEVATMIENLYDGEYFEMFSRTKREGWDVWGNQTDKFV